MEATDVCLKVEFLSLISRDGNWLHIFVEVIDCTVYNKNKKEGVISVA